jgi:[acyl-carrier-protein] S-malonyltransferase
MSVYVPWSYTSEDYLGDGSSGEDLPDLAGRTVFMFPGQGSQVEAMRDRVGEWFPEILDMVEEDPFAAAESTTRLLQPAVFCASVAGWMHASALNGDAEPVAFVGHSLGEFAALVAAGSLGIEDALRLVILRGELMEQAAVEACGITESGELSEGGMLAVLGLDIAVVERTAVPLRLAIAGDNAPGELVLSGDVNVLARASTQLAKLGGKTVRLPIRGAFHSQAMHKIRGPFEDAVRAAAPKHPLLPVFSSITGELFDDIPQRLAQSLTDTVRWRETLMKMREAGARNFVDVGPGKVLKGLVGRTLHDVQVAAVGAWDGTWTHSISTNRKETA